MNATSNGRLDVSESGVAIVAWLEDDGTVKAQEFDGTGQAQWEAGGIVVGNGDDAVDVVNDGVGGAVIVWGSDLHAQRLSATGAPLWVPGGVALGVQGIAPRILADGSGGCITAFQRSMGALSSIYVARVNGDGQLANGWPVGGVPCTASTYDQSEAVMTSDGAGGAIVAWSDARGSDADIFAQRVTSSGAIASGWPADGLPVCAATGAQSLPVCAADGQGGAMLTWEDARGVYCQHVLPFGVLDPSFANGGNALCTASGLQNAPTITMMDSLTAVVAWSDGRTCGSHCTNGVFAQEQLIGRLPSAVGPPKVGVNVVLYSGAPNPSHGDARIYFSLPRSSDTRLEIYDLAGKRVQRLVDGIRGPGLSFAAWNGRRLDGSRAEAGVYLLRLQAAGVTKHAKIILSR